jgi:hypothetical protein
MAFVLFVRAVLDIARGMCFPFIGQRVAIYVLSRRLSNPPLPLAVSRVPFAGSSVHFPESPPLSEGCALARYGRFPPFSGGTPRPEGATGFVAVLQHARRALPANCLSGTKRACERRWRVSRA